MWFWIGWFLLAWAVGTLGMSIEHSYREMGKSLEMAGAAMLLFCLLAGWAYIRVYSIPRQK